jgi:hypothetical protein
MWLLVVGIARRRVDPVAVVSTVTVALALAACALTGGDPLALKLRRGAVTGTLGIAALASVALGRPLLLMLAEHTAQLRPGRQPEIHGSLVDPDRRRAVTILTAIIGLTFTIDGASQIALALTVQTPGVRRGLDDRADRRPRYRPDRHDLVPPPSKGTARERTPAGRQLRASRG